MFLLSKGQLVAGNTKAWLGTDEIKEISFSGHTHDEYAPVNHTHDQYLTEDDVNKIPSVVQVGTIINTVQKSPEGYLKCDGQTISADEYPELCSHLQPSYTYYNSSAAFMLPAEFKDREDYVIFSDTLCAVVYNNDIYVANKANMSNYSSYTKKTAMSFVSKVDTTGLSINNAYVSGIYYSKALNMFAFRLNYQRFMETTTQSYMIFTYDFNNIASSYASSLGYGRFDGNYVHGVYNNSQILYGACSSTANEEYVQYGRQISSLSSSNFKALSAVSFVINNKVVFAIFEVANNSYTSSASITTTPGNNGSRKTWEGLPTTIITINNCLIKYCNSHVFVFTGTKYNTINTCYVSKYDTSTQILTCVNTFNMYGKSTIDLVSIENETKVLFISRDADSTILDVYDFNTETKLESITLQTSDWSTITDFSQYCIYNYGIDEHVTEYTTGLYNGVRFISPAAYTYQVPNITPTDSRINTFIKT